MRKRDYERLLKRAAIAYHLGSDEYGQIMDEATHVIPVGDMDDPDEAWEKFCVDLDEAQKTIRPTERQISQHKRKEKQKEIEYAKRELVAAQRRLDEVLREQS